MNDRAVPSAAAAAALNIGQSTLRRWAKQGAPIMRAARRGRGCPALYDVAAVRHWRQAIDAADARLLRIATELPDLIATAIDAEFRDCDRNNKRAVAGTMAACWYIATATALDRLRVDCADVRELGSVPAPIKRLQIIATQTSE